MTRLVWWALEHKHRSGLLRDLIYWAYLYLGVIDDPEEGGTAFWRWDFWNSRAVAQYREMERQQV